DCIRDFLVTGVQTCALPIYEGQDLPDTGGGLVMPVVPEKQDVQLVGRRRLRRRRSRGQESDADSKGDGQTRPSTECSQGGHKALCCWQIIKTRCCFGRRRAGGETRGRLVQAYPGPARADARWRLPWRWLPRDPKRFR